ncbi:MAG: AAA domain-containing protein [Nitrososphaeria archaeon]|nr:AAA domain-containing protein [Nitrososphaeria archaeon]NIN53530.1 AAA domain-containing protein [Nitrososphaeria archaeon]NIQ34049.1 AAA domain-containing protein [Nitrososphaeria archaeon]
MSAGELREKFEDFYRNYTIQRKHKYRDNISKLVFSEEVVLRIDFSDLYAFDHILAEATVNSPQAALEAANEAAMEMLRVENPSFAAKIMGINIQFTGRAGHQLKLREIESAYLNKLINVQGLLIRISQIRPLVTKAAFQCNTCKTTQMIPQRGLKMNNPTRCNNPECKAKRTRFTFLPKQSEFTDIQFSRLQESPEELPPGQIPRFIDIRLMGPLVEIARPGDPVLVNGIVLLREERSSPTSSLFDMVLEVNYIEPLTKEPSAITITEEEEKSFKELAAQGDAFNQIVDSFAPSLHGLKDVKESLLLSLFGGQERVLPDGVKVRGDIHVFLVGDPGTGKSELLKYIAQVAPKGIYTTGRGTTAAGLTAAVVKESGGGLVLEAGAVVLSDRGVCGIDEIDKMRPEDRVSLHEAMEQQTVSIAKGGIIATLNARATILAAANPAEGRYNPNRLIKDNIRLPVTLLSRFDLIHLIRDEPERDLDEALVDHVLDLRVSEEALKESLTPEFMKKYIAYAKRINPRLTEEAKEKIREFYLKMRETSTLESPISISPRQLDSLMRLSEARARADLIEEVSVGHVEDATRLVFKFLRQVGMDTETGAIDVDIILTGVPQKRRSRIGIVQTELENMQRELRGPVPREELIDRIMKTSKLSRADVEKLIDSLKTSGAIYEPKPGFVSRIYR